MLSIFDKSDYRYLHISCHGTNSSLSTTLDELSFSEFGELTKPYLKERRLFVSACSAVNDNLARVTIPKSGCYSLIGPRKDIHFRDAAIIWASFYHLIFKENPKAMARKNILPILKSVMNTFGVSLTYFSTSKKSKSGYKRMKLNQRLTPN